MDYEEFSKHVSESSLTPVNCGNGHWQIKGGTRLVNYYPSKSTIFAIGDERGRYGSVKEAIQQAMVENPVEKKNREYQELLKSGIGKTVTCPHCLQPAQFFPDSKHIYSGRDYGPVFHCVPCNAYVGCHDGTIVSKGTPADRPTRQARKEAHAAFDPLWQDGLMGRNAAYEWLKRTLNLPDKECHIGLFDVEMCDRVVAAVTDWLERSELETWNVYRRDHKGSTHGSHIGTVSGDSHPAAKLNAINEFGEAWPKQLLLEKAKKTR